MRRGSALLSLALLSACNAAASSPDSSPRSDAYPATAVGRVDSAEEARNLVASVDGVIAQVMVGRGDPVVVGQPLLQVDCGPRQKIIATRAAQSREAAAAASGVREGPREEEIRAATAEVQSAQAARTDAALQFDRVASLQEAGFVTTREVDSRRAARDNANAQFAAAAARRDMMVNGSRASDVRRAQAAQQSAQAELAVAQSSAGQCLLRSPINGTVLQVLRKEGEFSGASQGQPLIIVGDLSHLIVRAEVGERDAAKVHVGQAATAWVDGMPEKWHGSVTQMASVMGRRSARSLDPTDRFDRDIREVLISFDNKLPPALIGLRLTVELAR